jgi:hypothetical protein
MMRARCSRSAGQDFGGAVVQHPVALGPEGVLDELGLFEQIGQLRILLADDLKGATTISTLIRR